MTVEVYEDLILRLAEKFQPGDLKVKPITFSAGTAHDEDGEA
jgi:hypothetical protein